MRSGLSYLLAARQCEIAELEQLARTCALVGVIGRFIHALQRERGISNIFLASQGQRFGAQRLQQVADCRQTEMEVRVHFEQLDTEAGRGRNGSRLFSRIAVVLHGLDGLPALRSGIGQLATSPRDALAAYIKLVAGLLAVVFEAADSATDPKVSRALLALFNFMQGKEFAGQERACGAGAFATGRMDAGSQQHWRHLIAAQNGCFQVFTDFSDPQLVAAEHASREPEVLAELERLRRIGCTARPEEALDPNLSQLWYDICTRRMDAMKSVEEQLALHLRGLCEDRIAQARGELRDQRAILEALSAEAATAPASYGPQLERSILGLLQEQQRRLQAMADELDAVRASLNERKVVERAKGLLMAHRQMSESDAYKALRQLAMNQNRRLVDVAQNVLALAEVLPGGVR